MHLPPVNTEVDTAVDNADLVRRGRRLEYTSIACTVVEAIVALVAAASAGSMALLGFGVDSLVEVFSAAVVLWRLHPGEHGHRREQTALRLVGREPAGVGHLYRCRGGRKPYWAAMPGRQRAGSASPWPWDRWWSCNGWPDRNAGLPPSCIAGQCMPIRCNRRSARIWRPS